MRRAVGVNTTLLWSALIFLFFFPTKVLAEEVASTRLTPEQSEPPVASPVKKKKKKKPSKSKHKKSERGLDIQIRSQAATGYLSGRSYRSLPGAVTEIGLKTDLVYRGHSFKVAAPVKLLHSQTTSPLVQSAGRARLEASYRKFALLRPELGVQVSGVVRPNWPDYYQPILSTPNDADRLTTSRYSFWERQLRGELSSNLGGGHHLRLKYRYLIRQFVVDPHFDPYDRPMHLTPGDIAEHQLYLAWRWFFHDGNVSLNTKGYLRNYLYRFARDAGTGATHAGPGGAPPNPLQRFSGVSPDLGVKWKPHRRVQLRAGVRTTFNRDLFADYYTYFEVEPSLDLRFKWSASILVRATTSTRLRRYTNSGYQQTTRHPALDYGHLRQDDQFRIGVDTRYRLGKRVFLHTQLEALVRWTNFPDYVPGVRPPGKSYAINWDYANLRALAQLTYRLH